MKSKTKLRILQSGIGMFVLLLSGLLCPVEAALVSDNIEALDWDEIDVTEICTEAGGKCYISLNNVIHGITLASKE